MVGDRGVLQCLSTASFIPVRATLKHAVVNLTHLMYEDIRRYLHKNQQQQSNYSRNL